MSTPLDSTTFWSDQLVATQSMLAAYNAAILALITGGVQMYRLSTGQTDQMVTKLNLPALRAARSALLNEIATLDARVNGGSVQVTPNS